ncbi:MAG: lipopolysaccharide assembly protein LapB [Neisseriaceae bacterium]|nr:lipopolysaccharide assembly protein LapB [Neisseriaceae bacterium]MBP6861582.1 lipopolysaccharide assembly protein LapB [Neisseriaceae bacterium]
MEFEIWWIILLPIFFGMGWFAARVDMRAVLKQAKAVPIGFYKSLDALVDGKTDVAARALSEVVQAHPTAFELQMTLGKLYRKRGENDKAIRLHQALLESADIVADRRQQVLFELGENFQSAGLVDRAEQIFNGLLDGNMGKLSRQVLLSIYQQDRDWEKAIEMARTLSHDEQTYQFEIAQFYCELAQMTLFQSDLVKARYYVAQALEANKKCARANMILGDIEQKAQNHQAAIEAYSAIEKQNAEYLSMVGERLYDAFDALGKPEEGLALLEGYVRTFPQLDLIDVIYQKTLLLQGEAQASETVRQLVQLRPTLNGVYRLLGVNIPQTDLLWRVDADLVRTVVGKYAQKATMYRCKRCNFKSQVFFWHCPACNEWESYSPNRVEI